MYREHVCNAYQIVIVRIPLTRYVTIKNARNATTIIVHLGPIVLNEEPVWNAYQVVIVLILINQYVIITNARNVTIIVHLEKYV